MVTASFTLVVFLGISVGQIFFGLKPLLPFGLYKWLCGFGPKAPDDAFEVNYDGLSTFRFLRSEYQAWSEEVVTRCSMTRSEYLALMCQRIIDLDAEIQRRN